jgi:hypothetical protein
VATSTINPALSKATTAAVAAPMATSAAPAAGQVTLRFMNRGGQEVYPIHAKVIAA